MSVIEMSAMVPGQRGVIYSMPEGREARLRLEQMGLRCGMEIVISTALPMHGPMLVVVGRTEVAIGNELAGGILVNLPSGQHENTCRGMRRGHRRGGRRWFRHSRFDR